jgi:hypothetical protein
MRLNDYVIMLRSNVLWYECAYTVNDVVVSMILMIMCWCMIVNCWSRTCGDMVNFHGVRNACLYLRSHYISCFRN